MKGPRTKICDFLNLNFFWVDFMVCKIETEKNGAIVKLNLLFFGLKFLMNN